MKNLNLTAAIVQLVVGLVCLGLGIYYVTQNSSTMAVVFIVAGAVCVVMSVRSYLKIRRQKREQSEEEDKKE